MRTRERVRELEIEIFDLKEKIIICKSFIDNQTNKNSELKTDIEKVAKLVEEISKSFREHTIDDKENFAKITAEIEGIKATLHKIQSEVISSHASMREDMAEMKEMIALLLDDKKTRDAVTKDRGDRIKLWVKIFSAPVVATLLVAAYYVIKYLILAGII